LYRARNLVLPSSAAACDYSASTSCGHTLDHSAQVSSVGQSSSNTFSQTHSDPVTHIDLSDAPTQVEETLMHLTDEADLPSSERNLSNPVESDAPQTGDRNQINTEGSDQSLQWFLNYFNRCSFFLINFIYIILSIFACIKIILWL
jgi:hypothetical protein